MAPFEHKTYVASTTLSRSLTKIQINSNRLRLIFKINSLLD